MKLILTRARFVVLSRPKSMRIATQRKYEGGDPLNPIKILTEHLKMLSLKTVDQRLVWFGLVYISGLIYIKIHTYINGINSPVPGYNVVLCT